MPDQTYVITMATYNAWQNTNLVKAANGLSDAERQRDRGAFFGSVQQTFSHILWADHIWLSRFTGTAPPDGGIPESTGYFSDWADFQTERARFDQEIIEWANNVDPDWFAGDLSWYSGAVGRRVGKPNSILAIQLFNHQTHHRGQIHAMLTAAGTKTEATDVPFMPDPV